MTQMNRRNFAKGMAGVALSAALPVAADHTKQKQKPNILYVFSDQHRAAAMGCYGETAIATPNFDRFADQGIRCTNAVSNTPVCCPSRATLQTGLYAQNHGILTNTIGLDTDFQTLGKTFRSAGYATGYIGKWHLFGPTPKDAHGFIPPGPHRFGYDDWAALETGHHYFEFQYYRDKPEPIREIGYEPDRQVELAQEFIKKHKDQPWCLGLSWGPPHTPYTPPPAFEREYDILYRPNIPGYEARAFAEKVTPKYYGLIESLDAAFGRLLQTLDELGIADNTIVIYTSDHGDQLGCQGLKFKRWPFDESCIIPFLVRWPEGIPAGRVLDAPFGMVDVYPTLCGLVGLEAPATDGQDISAYWIGKNKTGPEQTFLTMPYGYLPWPGWRAVRTQTHLYAEANRKPWLLFDLHEDPYQMQNLAGQSSSLVAAYRERLHETMRRYGDSWEVQTTKGDIKNWIPGSHKFTQQDLDATWPGQQGWES